MRTKIELKTGGAFIESIRKIDNNNRKKYWFLHR